VGGNSYLKADTAYWTENGSAAAAKLAAGKYVKVPAGTGVGDLKVGTTSGMPSRPRAHRLLTSWSRSRVSADNTVDEAG